MKTFNASHESGRSMIEMLGVLAIIGVLSVGGIAGYSMAMSKFKTTKTIDQIQQITTNLRSILESQRRWPTISEASVFYQLGVLSEETYNGSAGVNPFGGEIILNTGTATDRAINILYKGLPKDVCVKLATTDWGGNAGSGLYAMAIGNNTYKWDGTTAATQLPIELTEALGKCGSESNSIAWVYK